MPQRRRLFRGNVDLAIARGFTRPQNRGAKEPLSGHGALGRLYVFARSAREARVRFASYLAAKRYKVLAISDVVPNRSNKPWPMDNLFITPADISRARASDEVVPGWLCGYVDDKT
jgi:hypothetical protein